MRGAAFPATSGYSSGGEDQPFTIAPHLQIINHTNCFQSIPGI
jgi:hypothetical protein